MDKSVQAFITHKYRSQAVQSNIEVEDHATSPMKWSHKSVSTSPFKVAYPDQSRPYVPSFSKFGEEKIMEEQSDSDISLYTPSVTRTDSSTSPLTVFFGGQ